MFMIKIGIFGYGNIGKGIECGIRQNPDMELAAVFTRRDPSTVKTVFEVLMLFLQAKLKTMRIKLML